MLDYVVFYSVLMPAVLCSLSQEPIGTHNAKPHPASPQKQKAAYVRDKYELRKYVRSLDANVARMLMWQAVFEVRHLRGEASRT